LQGFDDMANSGNYLEEIDVSVFGLPLTFLHQPAVTS
jgi:hypothetical protein